jgi:hypothetical protein
MDLALDGMYGWFYAQVEDGVIFKIRYSFIMQKVYLKFLAVNATLRWLNNVTCLFLSFRLITNGV